MGVSGEGLAKSLTFSLIFLLLFCAPAFSQYVCPPGANSTYVKADYSHDPLARADTATASIYVYYIDRTLVPVRDVGVKQGLVILDSGVFSPGATTYGLPDPNNVGQNSVCRMVTDDFGKITLTLPHPEFASQCVSHKFIYCPATLDPAELAKCAGLVDTANNRIKALDWSVIPPCPGTPASAAPFTETTIVNGKPVTTDQTLLFDSSQNQLQACGDTAGTPGQMQLCWVGGLAFGLLFAASFMSGRNPLQMFDFGTARSIGTRMGTTTGGPPPMQQYAFAPPASGLMSIADRAANLVFKGNVKEGLVSSKINTLAGKAADGLMEGVGLSGAKDDKGKPRDPLGLGLKDETGNPKDVKVSSAINSVARGLVMGAITGGMVGLVNLVGGKKGAGKKAGRAASSATVPYLYKAAGTMAGRGLDELATAIAPKGSDLRSVENKPPEISPDKLSAAATKAIEKKYHLKGGRVKLVPSLDGQSRITGYRIVDGGITGKDIGNIQFNADGTASGAVRKPGTDTGHLLNFSVSKDGQVNVKLVTPSSADTKQQFSMLVGGRVQAMSNSGVSSAYIGAIWNGIISGENVWTVLSDTFSVSSSAPAYTISNAHQDITVGQENLQLTDGKIMAKGMPVGAYNKDGPLVISINPNASGNLGGLVPGHSYQVADAAGTSQPPLDITDHAHLKKGDPEMQPVVLSASGAFKINGDDFVSVKNTDGTFALTNTVSNETYTARTDANGAISLTDGNNKQVDSISANGASFDFRYNPAKPDTIYVNTYGTLNKSFESQPWTADFHDASGQPMQYAGADGQPHDVHNFGDMTKAAFLPALNETLDKFISGGFSRGLKMWPFTTVDLHPQLGTGSVFSDALFDYTAASTLTQEFSRNPALSDIQRHAQQVQEEANEIRTGKAAQDAYNEANIGDDEKKMATKLHINEEDVPPSAIFGSKFDDLKRSPGGLAEPKPDLMQFVKNPIESSFPSTKTEELEFLLTKTKGILDPDERRQLEADISASASEIAQEALDSGTLLPGGASKALETVAANRYYGIQRSAEGEAEKIVKSAAQ